MIKKEDIKVGSYLQIRKFDLEAIAGPKFVEDINKHCPSNTCVVKVVNMADGMCEIKYSFWCIPAVVNTEGLAKVAISSSAKKTANRKTEQVSHPSHYAWLKDLCGVEPLDICRHLDFNTGNAIKYLLRKDKVDGNKTKTEKRIEDLRKAAFYIQDEIKLLERGTD